ncbi:MAG: TIGR04283 family arsenosugar biosynthesis glycosyltransferase [Ralstonia sp.]|jgi:rSAM/selenodomain-associated transferase 2|uniref:Glycosyltransferase 2-like domain-containing protein n=2 Tax=Ralstonia TaxID=48736 RepID=A0ABM9JIB1_9RALS|nr:MULTISPECIES: TIGR04283 family arsenosugar biosynthesis glycosyltransferase [Ralstonia]MBA9845290.1 glycosyltransferase [Ralstonia pickettii]MBA9852318.1 glycosyltransferase [Ralstonia pickettii]MBA9878710.1 glycosyltransferase [Ralstonia pickettii]MBA9881943.1 glycosyltransferase [Ralstonia pickettii]MBA9888786.1 glycosyltransferase [Ralstonia pickettii]
MAGDSAVNHEIDTGARIRISQPFVAQRVHGDHDVRPALCIILPVLNEAPTLEERLRALQAMRKRGARVVVVDGGSDDDTLSIARQHADLAFLAPRGRASQMNAGAAACPADILLFLHADTLLPSSADVLVARALRGPRQWGRFDVRLDSRRPALRLVETLMNVRSRWTGIATGDQAMFVRYEAFQEAGAFPDIPLMEDVVMSKRLKKLSPPACLRQRVVTSARRWERYGIWRTVLLMWRLRLAFFFGADPNKLAVQYGYQIPSR